MAQSSFAIWPRVIALTSSATMSLSQLSANSRAYSGRRMRRARSRGAARASSCPCIRRRRADVRAGTFSTASPPKRSPPSPRRPAFARSCSRPSAAHPSADESLTVREAEGTWKTIAPGARTKKLAKDGRRVSFLLDLDANAVVDAHDHGGGEDSYVIRGSCHIGALALNVGDFHHVEAGAHHGDVVASDEGCLLLITLEMPAAA